MREIRINGINFIKQSYVKYITNNVLDNTVKTVTTTKLWMSFTSQKQYLYGENVNFTKGI